jgi:hypothetical protein
MTANRGAKQANRRRKAETGETYTQARKTRRREQSLAELRALCEGPIDPYGLDGKPGNRAPGDADYEDPADYDGMWMCPDCLYMPVYGETSCPNGCEEAREELRERRAAEDRHRCYQQSPVPAVEFLALLEERPELMPRARSIVEAAAFDERRAMRLACLRCGQPSTCAYRGQHKHAGLFWLDLCAPCSSAVGMHG